MSRGNPNQQNVVDQIKQLGFNVKVIHNQICIDGEDPMTVKEAREFVEMEKYFTENEKCGELE